MLFQREQNKYFSHRINTGEKLIYYESNNEYEFEGIYNPKCPKALTMPGEKILSTLKRNIRSSKVMLYIWRDRRGVVLYYELVKRFENITNDRYW